MTTTQFGTKIPDNSTEFWELYGTTEIIFVPMYTKYMFEIEIPSYEVVEHLMNGYTFQTTESYYKEAREDLERKRFSELTLGDVLPKEEELCIF